MTSPDVESADLVVLSHLRWSWVWQRPQHLISRIARCRAAGGGRTWFVEEPIQSSTAVQPRLCQERHGAVRRVWLEIPGRDARLPFNAPETQRYAQMLAGELGPCDRDVWLYSPMALDIAEAMHPRVLVFDVMDDLAAFAQAPGGLALRHRRALAEADVVFTGGRSLHQQVLASRTAHVHCFPSGVEVAHWRKTRLLRAQRVGRGPHVAGYVGVVDERIDLGLIGALAAALPDWQIRVVGPVAKIDPSLRPQAPNILYRGQVPYEELPEVLAGFDVALMPFALNEATRSISPTKTLEYLAAGLPVVSTRVPDVVADHSAVVHLVDNALEAAAACRAAVEESQRLRDQRCAALFGLHEWDAIASRMSQFVADAVQRRISGSRGLPTVERTA